ncbi:MAG: AIR synthase family protein [Halodesulfurarchaeum sp.]
MDPGKVDRPFFERHIRPRLGASRADVRLGPAHGADFGVIDIGDRVLALATDPLFVLRELGLERAAWFAFHIVVSDVALSGLDPTHLSVDVNLPPSTDPETFESIWEVFDREARTLGASIVTGHTGAYAGSSFPTIGGATALAVGSPEDLILPTDAEPGDRVLITKGPAIETTGVLAVVFGDEMDLPQRVIQAGRERFAEASPVEDALTAAGAGPVTAMHDATEGGVENALLELAAASDVRLSISRDQIPVGAGVNEICEYVDVDPWTASSEGTVILTVEESGVGEVLDALEKAGIRSAAIGSVGTGTGVTIDGEQTEPPEQDPFWPAYERARDRFG